MPRNRGTRRRIATGIYEDDVGRSAVVKVGPREHAVQREKRFKTSATLTEMKEWQRDTDAALRKALKRAGALSSNGANGTDCLRRDAKTYLATVKTLASYDSRVADLDAWLEVFGDEPRLSLTRAQLQAQMEIWKAEGYAYSTLCHRRTALSQVYDLLNNDDDRNPAEKLRCGDKPDLEPREIPLADVHDILAAMPDSKAKAMAGLMAFAGLPPARIRRLRPKHCNAEAGTVFLVRRRKGKGAAGKTFRLTRRGTAALKFFIRMKAWDGVAKESLTLSFQRAVVRVNVQRAAEKRPLLPEGIRVYDLRHSFGTWAYRTTKDIRATADLLDCTVETALRYTLGAVPDTVSAVIDGLDATLGYDPRGLAPRAGPVKSRRKHRHA